MMQSTRNRKVFIKDKGIHKGHKVTKQPQANNKADGDIINFSSDGAMYRIIYNNCTATVMHASDDAVLGIYKTASRKWKNDANVIPATIRHSVESLYT